jgi:hypothetical protein
VADIEILKPKRVMGSVSEESQSAAKTPGGYDKYKETG